MLIARFTSKHPHTTLTLEVTYHAVADHFPMEHLTDLLAPLGWVRQDKDPQRPIMPAPALPDGTADISFHKAGSALFKSWTPEERRAFMPAVRKALRQFGFVGPLRHHRLTAEECC